MAAFVGRLNAITRETGAAVPVIRHPGKDDARGMRGSTVLFAACDAVIKIAANGNIRQVVTERSRKVWLGEERRAGQRSTSAVRGRLANHRAHVHDAPRWPSTSLAPSKANYFSAIRFSQLITGSGCDKMRSHHLPTAEQAQVIGDVLAIRKRVELTPQALERCAPEPPAGNFCSPLIDKPSA